MSPPASIPATQLLVFDLDGTLIDSAEDLIAALNYVLAQDGMASIPSDYARPMVGLGARMLITRGFAAHGHTISSERLEILFHTFMEYYEAHIADHSRSYPGVIDALDRFEQAGWIFAVCTNKVERAAVKLLETLNLSQRFRAICGQDTFTTQEGNKIAKPNPLALLRTIEAAGGMPETSIMVGDSYPDIAAAQSAYIPVIAVDFGYCEQPIHIFSPDRVISHFDSLWSCVTDLRS